MPVRAAILLLVIGAGCVVTKAPEDDRQVERCDNGVDDDLDGAVDCDDRDCLVACSEVCDDGIDNDSDGLVDCADPGCADACGQACDCSDPDCVGPCTEDCADGVDDDGDGDIDCADADCALTCDGDRDGSVGVAFGGTDCDDANPYVHPLASELCNGIDDDCDGDIDDADSNLLGATRYYADADGDGWGTDLLRLERCTQPSGFVEDGGDCDDANDAVNPGAAEICNGGLDDDCSGLADDEDPGLDPGSLLDLYADGDSDGLGAGPSIGAACTPGAGEAANDLDCDDTDPAILAATDWLADDDDDGFGAGAVLGPPTCAPPILGAVPASLGVDCAPLDPTVSPGAPEVCTDGVDNDCDLDLDCLDGDCGALPVCGCAEQVLASTVPLVVNDTTLGAFDDVTPTTCGYSAAEDVVFEWAPPAPGLYTIDTVGSLYDTVLYVLDGCGGLELACNDDFSYLQSQVQVNLLTTQPILIVVDGYAASAGSFVLNIY